MLSSKLVTALNKKLKFLLKDGLDEVKETKEFSLDGWEVETVTNVASKYFM